VRGAKGGGEPRAADALQEIAGCAARECVHDVVGTVRAAQDDDQRLRRGLRDPRDCVETVVRQLEIDEADVRPEPRRERYRRDGVLRLGDDGEVVRLEPLANASTMRQIVVCYENRQMLMAGVPPGPASVYLRASGRGLRRLTTLQSVRRYRAAKSAARSGRPRLGSTATRWAYTM
jgi:hypothetical protein